MKAMLTMAIRTMAIRTMALRTMAVLTQAVRVDEVARARHKIEETHKNYYALLASSDVGTAGDPLKEKKNPGESMSLMRNEWYAFTATGMFRP